MKSKSNGLAFSLSMVAFVISGCSQAGRSYDSLSKIVNEGDLSVAKAAAIPDDASSINIRSDAETGLYYVSYDTSHAVRYIDESGMLRVGKGLAPLIRDSLGFAAKLPPNIDLYYRCIISLAPLPDVRENYHEIIMMGSDGRRQYLWNRLNDGDLEAILCRPVGNGGRQF
ncbi:hypothetical protein [Stenotrophomonas sp. NA06056]|uniref:hypothetical protein n=1 Tax=Stenotrophomonas sp. NA06056 TaxID=2742129 RepID=UPI00158A874F|nr:hypothetical protein [Stenotrophomonas sp. NA06056]QKW58613.1 hypothetical protein HUT07_19165 [Stenotrophomonas sp. NA06056]